MAHTNESPVAPQELFDELDRYLSRTDVSEEEKVQFVRTLCTELASSDTAPRGPEIALPRLYEWN